MGKAVQICKWAIKEKLLLLIVFFVLNIRLLLRVGCVCGGWGLVRLLDSGGDTLLRFS